MQIIRTLTWVLITIVMVAFIAINWTPVEVRIWPLESGYLHFNWPVGFIVLVSFLLGMLPMWLLHKAKGWRLTRRINTLENAVRATSTPPPPSPMAATSTQLEANATDTPAA